MIIILDTETNGRDGEEREVIELAWMEVVPPLWSPPAGPMSARTETRRFRPRKGSTVGALSVHHILDRELEDQPDSSAARLPEEVQYIIGHGVDHDWESLKKPQVKRICTLAMARNLYPEVDSHRLGAMLYALFPDHEEVRRALKDAHSALADTIFCQRILVKMLRDTEKHFQSVEDLWKFSEECRIPKFMPFGKHKGMEIAKLPGDYKSWCLRQPDFDPYILEAIRRSSGLSKR